MWECERDLSALRSPWQTSVVWADTTGSLLSQMTSSPVPNEILPVLTGICVNTSSGSNTV